MVSFLAVVVISKVYIGVYTESYLRTRLLSRQCTTYSSSSSKTVMVPGVKVMELASRILAGAVNVFPVFFDLDYF